MEFRPSVFISSPLPGELYHHTRHLFFPLVYFEIGSLYAAQVVHKLVILLLLLPSGYHYTWLLHFLNRH